MPERPLVIDRFIAVVAAVALLSFNVFVAAAVFVPNDLTAETKGNLIQALIQITTGGAVAFLFTRAAGRHAGPEPEPSGTATNPVHVEAEVKPADP